MAVRGQRVPGGGSGEPQGAGERTCLVQGPNGGHGEGEHGQGQREPRTDWGQPSGRGKDWGLTPGKWGPQVGPGPWRAGL